MYEVTKAAKAQCQNFNLAKCPNNPSDYSSWSDQYLLLQVFINKYLENQRDVLV